MIKYEHTQFVMNLNVCGFFMYLHILQPKLCQKHSACTALKQKCNILFPSSIGMMHLIFFFFVFLHQWKLIDFSGDG